MSHNTTFFLTDSDPSVSQQQQQNIVYNRLRSSYSPPIISKKQSLSNFVDSDSDSLFSYPSRPASFNQLGLNDTAGTSTLSKYIFNSDEEDMRIDPVKGGDHDPESRESGKCFEAVQESGHDLSSAFSSTLNLAAPPRITTPHSLSNSPISMVSTMPSPTVSPSLSPIISPYELSDSSPNLRQTVATTSSVAGSVSDPARIDWSHLWDYSPSDSRTQLIMPRVTLPSRRPFTSNGLKIGKLKILIAGDSGIGKSRLIKTIANTCHDIVHMDDYKSVWTGDPKYQSKERPNVIGELYGSTKPLPLFWSCDDIDVGTARDGNSRPVRHSSSPTDSSTLRKQSLIESSQSVRSDERALDRNICFVDTIGYGRFSQVAHCVDPVINYLENGFKEAFNVLNTSNPQKVLSILSSSSSLSEFSHVDVCFYAIHNTIKQVDIDYMSKVSVFVPVIPIIVKSDLLPEIDIIDLKVTILKKMRSAHLTPFLFDTHVDDAIRKGRTLLEEYRKNPRIGNTGRFGSSFGNSTGDIPVLGENEINHSLSGIDDILFPCAVSTAENPVPELDASILMSPDYSPELIKSELDRLCCYVFSEHGSSWLRYTTAKKFIHWCSNEYVNSSLQVRLDNGFSHSRDTRMELDGSSKSLIALNRDLGDSNFIATGKFVVNLPSNVFESRQRAQNNTARWAMQLEQVSRAENSIAIRARASLNRYSTSLRSSNNGSLATPYGRRPSRRLAQKTSRQKLSGSIMNLDPLNLRFLSRRLIQYALRTISVLVGIKLFAVWFRQVTVLSIKETNKKLGGLTTASQSSDNFFVSSLSSLGGGWASLV